MGSDGGVLRRICFFGVSVWYLPREEKCGPESHCRMCLTQNQLEPSVSQVNDSECFVI